MKGSAQVVSRHQCKLGFWLRNTCNIRFGCCRVMEGGWEWSTDESFCKYEHDNIITNVSVHTGETKAAISSLDCCMKCWDLEGKIMLKFNVHLFLLHKGRRHKLQTSIVNWQWINMLISAHLYMASNWKWNWFEKPQHQVSAFADCVWPSILLTQLSSFAL